MHIIRRFIRRLPCWEGGGLLFKVEYRVSEEDRAIRNAQLVCYDDPQVVEFRSNGQFDTDFNGPVALYRFQGLLCNGEVAPTDSNDLAVSMVRSHGAIVEVSFCLEKQRFTPVTIGNVDVLVGEVVTDLELLDVRRSFQGGVYVFHVEPVVLMLQTMRHEHRIGYTASSQVWPP